MTALFYALFHSLCLAVAALLFLWPVHHRTRPLPRIGLGLLALVVLFTLWYLYGPHSLMAQFVVAYLLVFGLFALCADLSWSARLYCSIWAMFLYGINAQLFAMMMLSQQPAGVGLLVLLVVLCLIYAAVGGTIALWMPDQGDYHIGPRQLTSAFLLLVIDLSTIWQFVALGGGGTGSWQSWTIFLMIELYCGTILYLQHELFRKSAIRQELDMLNHIWAQQKVQYTLAKENIALINRKCHDLKHQIKAMRLMFSNEDREKYIQEMEQSIQIYDLMAKTGNEVLDTVLTEKSLSCEANGIQVHCVADGRLLSFLDPVDLYTMFGNALDNAIEAVKHLPSPEQRLIDVLIYEEKQFYVVQIINPLAQVVEFDRDGLPHSTKGEKDYHGFGLRSIRHTAQKHGGILRVKTQDGCFYLQILFPRQG